MNHSSIGYESLESHDSLFPLDLGRSSVEKKKKGNHKNNINYSGASLPDAEYGLMEGLIASFIIFNPPTREEKICKKPIISLSSTFSKGKDEKQQILYELHSMCRL